MSVTATRGPILALMRGPGVPPHNSCGIPSVASALQPPVPPQHLRPRDGRRQGGGAQERAEG